MWASFAISTKSKFTFVYKKNDTTLYDHNEKNYLRYLCLWFDNISIIEYIYITTDECIMSANLWTTDGICVRGSQFFCGLNHFINIQQFLGFLLQVNQVLCRKILSSGTWHLSGSTWCHLCHFEVYI